MIDSILFFLQYNFAYNFKGDTGYRIRVVGEEERYVVNINGTVRSVLADDIDNVPGALSVVEVIHDGGSLYKLKFCNGYLSAMPKSAGIITHNEEDDEYAIFEIRNKGDSLQFYNKTKKKCVAQIDSHDDARKGYYLNSRDCDSDVKSLMVLLEIGPIYYHCEDLAELYCAENGFELINTNIDHHYDSHHASDPFHHQHRHAIRHHHSSSSSYDNCHNHFNDSDSYHDHHKKITFSDISDPFRHFSNVHNRGNIHRMNGYYGTY